MAKFLKANAEEIAAEIMNDIDSDDGDIYGEDEEEEDNFSDHPLPSFPQDFMSPTTVSQEQDDNLVEDPDNIDLVALDPVELFQDDDHFLNCFNSSFFGIIQQWAPTWSKHLQEYYYAKCPNALLIMLMVPFMALS